MVRPLAALLAAYALCGGAEGRRGPGAGCRRLGRRVPPVEPQLARSVPVLAAVDPRFPHPISPGLLRRGVQPSPGDHVLEIGSGTGRHAVQVAQWIAPAGTLDVFDVQQDMLDAVMRRAGDQSITNITPAHGQAGERLPYADARFDAAYLVTVIGEIPDPDVALRELRRVLRPGGRLAVGEVLLDPDYVSLGELRSRAEACGFAFVRRYGSPFAYVAQFEAV